MLKAKLHAPAIDKNIISREKLLHKLRHVPECKLTLVTAPAGYGKTTAVLHWLLRCGLPSAWLSLDSHDNSPGVFWRYVCSALDNIINGVSKETEYVFSYPEMLKSNIHINILIDKLAKVESDFILVLDDLHYITEPSIMEGLSYLIDYLPEKMHLICISRTAPEINLARHKFKWQIQHLEEKDLRFGDEEIFLFYQARGIILENSDIRKVKSYTEGWAAALVAVAMSLEDSGENRDIIAGLTASGEDIGQYLNNEILRTWSEEKRTFALRTCILDTLSEDICNAVTGKNNSKRMLTEIYEGNGFLIAMDAERREYRYHQLFRSFLRKLLSEKDPIEIPKLHAKAGFWFKEHGMMPEAIDHLLDGCFYKEAFELIEHRIDNMIRHNDFDRLLPWVERLPEAYKSRSFKTAAIYAMYFTQTGRTHLSRQWLDRMKTLREEYEYSSGPEWSAYSLTVCNLTEANLLAREGNVGFMAFLFSAAENKSHKISDYHDFNMADIYFYRCPINVLTKLFRQAPEKYHRMIERYRGMIIKNPGYATLAIGEYYYESNKHEKALPYLLKALEEAQAAGCPGTLVPVMVNLARIRRAVGDIKGALDILKECGEKLQGMGKAHWNYVLAAFRCRLYMDIGDTPGVDEWFASSKLGMFTELSKAREFELIVYARVLVCKGRLQDAKLLLERLLSFTDGNNRNHSRVEILNLLALLHYRENDVPNSMDCLEKALVIGMKEGYLRSFLDEFIPMAKLLNCYTAHKSRQAEHPEAKALVTYARNLSRQLQEYIGAVTESIGQTAAEKKAKKLTAQETKVLELLAKAKTNREIGLMLGISLTTVKTHTRNIYGKLDVQNRVQCIKRIHETGLLK